MNLCLPDNTANIILTHGRFRTDSPVENVLDIEITDGGTKPLSSVTRLHLKVCTCGPDRQLHSCREFYKSGISTSAIVAILFCIVAILGKSLNLLLLRFVCHIWSALPVLAFFTFLCFGCYFVTTAVKKKR